MTAPGPTSPQLDGDALTTRWDPLLDAVAQLGGDLELRAVLQRLADAARELAGARYAAIGVLGADGWLEDFITSGMTSDQRARIGALPRGRGILGELLRRPEPLRLRDLREHASSAGFPPGHPVMRSFLGVPLRTGATVFGNIYLTDKLDTTLIDGDEDGDGEGGFTEEDEQVLVALAAAAGVAVQNARLYDQVLTRQRWSAASAAASRALVPAGRAAGSREVARLARAAAGASAAVLLLAPAGRRDGPLLVEAVDGDLPLAPGAEIAPGASAEALEPGPSPLTPVPPLLAEALGLDAARRHLVCRVDSRQGRRERPGEAPSPLTHGGEVTDEGDAVTGLLVLCLESDAQVRAVTEAAAEVTAFADRVALSLELARVQAYRARLAVFEDRDRIARDLHDLVIQRLFAVGMSLQAAGPQALPAWLEQRLETAVDDLDETIKDVRRTIFSLHVRPRAGDVRADVEHEVGLSAEQLGFTPALHLEGPLDTLTFALRADVLAVLRETLSNVARHAGASAVDVVVSAGDVVTVTVRDDGRGTGPPARRSGLANLEERAAERGGSLVVEGPPGRGTVVRWSAPVG